MRFNAGPLAPLGRLKDRGVTGRTPLHVEAGDIRGRLLVVRGQAFSVLRPLSVLLPGLPPASPTRGHAGTMSDTPTGPREQLGILNRLHQQWRGR